MSRVERYNKKKTKRSRRSSAGSIAEQSRRNKGKEKE
jgi:hypothetical protein